MSKAAALVTWSDDFALGMQEIDEQHRVLIELINRVWVAVVKRVDRAEALPILEELERYTITHFTAEEVFMREIAYSGFREHKIEHDTFVSRIAAEKAKIAGGQPVALELVHFLKDWLINHILVGDKAYADQYRKQSSGILGRFFKRLLS